MLLQRGRTKCENLRTNERYEVAEARDVTAFASSRAFSRAFCSTLTANRYSTPLLRRSSCKPVVL